MPPPLTANVTATGPGRAAAHDLERAAADGRRAGEAAGQTSSKPPLLSAPRCRSHRTDHHAAAAADHDALAAPAMAAKPPPLTWCRSRCRRPQRIRPPAAQRRAARRAGHVLEAAAAHGRTAHAAAGRNEFVPPLNTVAPLATPATPQSRRCSRSYRWHLPPTATNSTSPLFSVVPLAAPATFWKPPLLTVVCSRCRRPQRIRCLR